jgi:undecaprenyl diphosphate synthase
MDYSEIAEPGTEEDRLVRQLDPGSLPRHLAVIMDGNGRWAGRRRLPRVAGHRSGIQAVRETVEVSARLGIPHLTLYAFSRENWKRPKSEVDTLMGLLKEYVRKELHLLIENDIRFRVLGRMSDLSKSVRGELEHALEATSGNSGMTFNIALSYGGRTEIVDAVRTLVEDNVPASAVNEEAISSRLYTAGQPDPDLLIRTSGEMRISNFLLWQIAYAEIYVTDVLWPDFRKRQLFEALLAFQGRERRYGGLSPERGSRTPETA